MNYKITITKGKKTTFGIEDMPRNKNVDAYKQYHGFMDEFHKYHPPVEIKFENGVGTILADAYEDKKSEVRVVVIRLYDMTTWVGTRDYHVECRYAVESKFFKVSTNVNVVSKNFFSKLWKFSPIECSEVLKMVFEKFATRKGNKDLEKEVPAFKQIFEKTEKEIEYIFVNGF